MEIGTLFLFRKLASIINSVVHWYATSV